MPPPPPPKKRTNDYNLLQCNPATLRDTKQTCLPQPLLERLRSRWNELYPQHRIPLTIKKKQALWGALRKRLATARKCASEYCAIQEIGDTAMQAASEPFFRPRQPTSWLSNPQEWHDSITLSRVMEQYEEAYPSFEFIGPVPIDFDESNAWGQCVVDELCRLDLSTLAAAGTRSVGIIFNLDPHDKPGSHWICAYCDLVAGAAYYYDSYGMRPPKEIIRFLHRCKEQGCKSIIWNDVRHQRKDSECGTYCLYVLISLLQGRSFADICRNPVPDDTMNALRDLLFATAKPREQAIRDAIKLLRT